MATTITLGGTDITDNVQDWSVQVPISPVDVAPSASLTTNARVDISATDAVTITVDGTDIFDGETRSGGTTNRTGQVGVDVAHSFRDVAEDTVTFTETSPTDEQVLQAALNDSEDGGSFTLDYAGTATSLGNDYECEGRPVKRVFRDMMDRTSRVWWVDPAGTTVHVEPVGHRGTWQAINTETDKATLRRWEPGDVDTVRNAVEVVGTGDVAVRGVASDQTSIDTYGRRPGNSPYNVDWITTATEADNLALELLIPDPLGQGVLLVGQNVGDVTQPLANYTVDVTDDGKGVDVSGQVIESQTIEQGRAELQIGEGTGVSLEEVNRKTQSREDNSQPGSVYGTDRLNDAAVTEVKLADLSISETKIQDDSISTPKLQAEAVTAAKILANTITAAEIDVLNLATGELTISDDPSSPTTGVEFVVDSNGNVDFTPLSGTVADIGATRLFDRIFGRNLRGTLGLSVGDPPTAALTQGRARFNPASGDTPIRISDPDSTTTVHPESDNGARIGEGGNAFAEMHAYSFVGEGSSSGIPEVVPSLDQTGSVGKDGQAWQSVRAYNFIDASDGTAINDGGDPLAGLADGHGPPDHALADGNLNLSAAVRSAWDVIRAQERVIEDLTARVGDLEARLERLEADGDSGDA